MFRALEVRGERGLGSGMLYSIHMYCVTAQMMIIRNDAAISRSDDEMDVRHES
jgi:hypothetical protein